VPETNAPPLLRWAEAEADAAGATVAVTTRHGGVSLPPYDTLNLGLHVGDDAAAVVTNRSRAAVAFGAALGDLVFARQIHGAAAAHVTHGDAGRGTTSEKDALAGADIVVTSAPDVTLVILAADCVPLALVDPAAHVLAAVHAGWRGTAAGAVGVALRAMSEHGARPERVVAFVGPAVAPEHYQVGDEVRDALATAPGGGPGLDAAVARPDGPGRWLVDLVAANRDQLLAGGVAPEHIFESGVTTAHPALYSDRAARPCGRFGLLARLLA
jgi:YfiH family protein